MKDAHAHDKSCLQDIWASVPREPEIRSIRKSEVREYIKICNLRVIERLINIPILNPIIGHAKCKIFVTRHTRIP